MAIYRFRVSFEEFDDVHRDIEIRSNQTFEQFHYCIQQAIGFDNSKPASFFMSNDHWKKGQEITNENTPDRAGLHYMKEARLSDYITDPHQKIYYVFDQPSHWTFYVELIKIIPETLPEKDLPVCVKSIGDAPKQYVKIEAPKGIPDPEFMEEDLFNELLVNEDEESVDSETDGEGSEGSEVSEEENDYGDGVDEEEYDNIEETSEDDTERE